MTKQDLIKTFGSIQLAAKVLEISRQALHKWPDPLQQYQEDWVVGACKRLSIPVNRAEKKDVRA